jgi:hypothetical protein
MQMMDATNRRANNACFSKPGVGLGFGKEFWLFGNGKRLFSCTLSQNCCSSKSRFKLRRAFATVWMMTKDKSSLTTQIRTLTSKKELEKMVSLLNDYG